ncbi:MAG TPA: hypothetical protein VGN72_10825 [Tepidisphaeraceae bacterium]|jgi:hypothetical protein|nr:hypothetical protein [Tepidisphaeraceae bacterium]
MQSDDMTDDLGTLERGMAITMARSVELSAVLRRDDAGDVLTFDLRHEGRTFARGRFVPQGRVVGHATRRRSRGGLRLRLRIQDEGSTAHWSIAFVSTALGDREAGVGLVQVVERARARAAQWVWRFDGQTMHTHRQLVALSEPAAEGRSVRLGAFTQYGQLYDLRDWVFAEQRDGDDDGDGGRCAGMIALRSGRWSHPRYSLAEARGDGALENEAAGDRVPAGVSVNMAYRAETLRRTYLLATAPTEVALKDEKHADAPTDLGRKRFTAWPAQQIARYGFARPERLTNQQRLADRMPSNRPQHFAFGAAGEFEAARDRVGREPGLAAENPFWLGDFDQARRQVLDTLRRFSAALTGAAFLSPLGNPVSARVLGPTAAMVHLLDFTGHLGDADRREAVGLIADLAELLRRRDFYPWHICHRPPEVPYDDYDAHTSDHHSLYRGMMNQNFHTDAYAFVGLAGCVLPNHPYAARWRRHAVEQFHGQMRSFVWPYPDGYGCWEESHTYANHVKLCLLPLALAMRHAPEPVDLMADARFLAMCRYFVPLLSPPDPIHDGDRAIPAIGDHGYSHKGGYGYLFGWLATLVPAEREAYLWAWQAMGAELGKPDRQCDTFGPLLQANPKAAAGAAPPSVPPLLHLPGFGAAARRRFGTADEALLVIRCGDAWGHYHPDESSFWWWQGGRLLACDADLGDGPLKVRHAGHNVLGFPELEPLQHLDRHGFHVDRCEQQDDGAVVVRCQVPFNAQREGTRYEPIPYDHRPHVTRTFRWRPDGTLVIDDEPTRSPDGRVEWRLHVPALSAQRVGPRDVAFDIGAGARLVVRLPAEPQRLELEPGKLTWRLFCTYGEQSLRHELTLVAHAAR